MVGAMSATRNLRRKPPIPGSSRASAIISRPARAPRYAQAECTELSARSLSSSHGATSVVMIAPAAAQSGRPPGNRSSITHWWNGSATTGTLSAAPSAADARRMWAALVAGTIRSTMLDGNSTPAGIAAPATSRACSTMPRIRTPLPCRLSQHRMVSGACRTSSARASSAGMLAGGACPVNWARSSSSSSSFPSGPIR